MSALNKYNKKSTRNYSESDILSEQAYKLYYINTKELDKKKAVDDINSLLKDSNGNKQAVSFSTDEADRMKSIYETYLKNKKIDDVKVIVHPSHDANKLFFITSNNEKYIVPSIVDGKENEVGLNSGKKYSEEEILENIYKYIQKSNSKGLN